MADLDTYKSTLMEARRTGSTKVLSNFSLGHARTVIVQMLDMAAEHGANVYIVSGNLDANCYDDEVVGLAGKVLSAGGFVRAWVTEGDARESTSPMADFLRNQADKNNVPFSFIRNIPEEFKDISHFLVVGNHAYRYEIDKETKEATLSFNDTDFAKSLLAFCEYLVNNTVA